MITMATTEPSSLPMRILNRGPEYFRSTNPSVNGSESRRKTAAERLEADKLKYVKSAKARQRRATTEIYANLKTENAENRFAGSATPAALNDDDITTRDKSNSKASRGLNRSNTDVDTASRLRMLNSGRFRNKRGQNGIKEVENSFENKGGRSRSPKDGRTGKSFSSYLNKAKEGLKAVTSTIAGGSDNADVAKARQSRSAVANSSKYRSSSVGANHYRVNKDSPPGSQKQSSSPPGAGTVSPRTQLKQARQNLKKVNSMKSEKDFSPAHHRVKTFTVVPRCNDENQDDMEVKDNSSSVKSPRALGRSRSLIENKGDKEAMVPPIKRKTHDKHLLEDFDKEKAIKGETEPANGSASARLLSSQRLKRRSLDISVDNSLPAALTKSSAAPSTPPDPNIVQATPLSSLPQAQKRQSWARLPPSTSDMRKNESRVSFHEDTYPNRPGTRKSLSEALEEVLNPQEDDDMDTAYHSMSPDASMDCKTLVAPSSSYGERSSTTIVETINTFRRGPKEPDNLLRSKTPDSLRSKTPTGDDGISFEANDVEISTRRSPERCKDSPPDSLNRRRNRAEEQRQWLNANDVTSTSQPLNRIDLAPSQESSGGIPNSPMLAPRARREVAPGFVTNMSPSRSHSREDHVNTMRSQNTSSSASGDINKPLADLTASDLKPRRGKIGGMTHYYAPMKPTCPYPINNYQGSPIHHSSTPTSPTSSPHKQGNPHHVRMTPSHGSRSSSSSTPYSSLKRNRQRSRSDVSIFQNELDKFFSTMGMNELASPLLASRDTLFTTAHVSSESDFSFAGASAYVRDGPDENMEVDPATAGLASAPSVSIIEKNARVMRWLMACKKNLPPAPPTSPRAARPPPPQPYKISDPYDLPPNPPPIPPRLTSYETRVKCTPKESDV